MLAFSQFGVSGPTRVIWIAPHLVQVAIEETSIASDNKEHKLVRLVVDGQSWLVFDEQRVVVRLINQALGCAPVEGVRSSRMKGSDIPF